MNSIHLLIHLLQLSQLHSVYDNQSNHLLIHFLLFIWFVLLAPFASCVVSNGANRSADSFYTANVVRLSTTMSTSYCIWNEFNAFAYSLSTTSVVRLTRFSTSYLISNEVHPRVNSFSTTNIVRLTYSSSSLSYSI